MPKSNARKGFENVTRKHVEQALRELAPAAGPSGGSYFVRFEGVELPAKRVLREAYLHANGVPISAQEFSGGLYSARILSQLGFEVVVRQGGPGPS
jgi:hypothetical protein